MAHEIEANYAFFDKAPWHDRGIVLGRHATIEEALELAYPFEVTKLPMVQCTDGIDVIDAPGYCAVVRIDPRGIEAHKVLGIHSDRYEVTPPADLLELFRPLIESGDLKLVAGGSLYEGKQLWFLAEIGDSTRSIIGDDVVKKFALLQTSFDGSRSCGLGDTDVRVVCANTLRAAQGDITMKAKHTKSVMDRMTSHRNTLARMIKGYEETVEKYRHLARKPMSRRDQEAYITQVVAPDLLNPEKVDDVSTKLKNKVQSVIDLLDTQKGLELVPAIRGTTWQAFNAITDYTTHHAGNSVDARMASQWAGPNSVMTNRALDLALTF